MPYLIIQQLPIRLLLLGASILSNMVPTTIKLIISTMVLSPSFRHFTHITFSLLYWYILDIPRNSHNSQFQKVILLEAKNKIQRKLHEINNLSISHLNTNTVNHFRKWSRVICVTVLHETLYIRIRLISFNLRTVGLQIS